MNNFILQIHITGKCNCRCKHCYIDSEAKELSVSGIEKILSDFKELVLYLQKKQGRKIQPFVNITGGEPLLHSQIFDVMDLIDGCSDFFSFRLMTNGTVFDAPILSRIKRLNVPCIQVSLDGDEEKHDYLRGKGNFRAVLEGLDRLNSYGIESKVSFTAHSENFRVFPKVARICREHNVSSLWSDRYVSCLASPFLKMLDTMETKEYVELLHKERKNPANREAKLQILNRRALQFLSSGEYPYYCTAGLSSVAVDEEGNVYPCRRLNIKCGNVFNDSLKSIYENSPVFLKLRSPEIPQQCVSCVHSALCRGGAKCVSYAFSRDMNRKDNGCWL